MRRTLLYALVPAFAACQPESEIARQSQTDTFYQEPAASVDILWVIDNSISMIQEQAEIAEQFGNFIGMMDSSGSAIDFHAGIVTTDMDDDNPKRGMMVASATDPAPFITRDTANYVQEFQSRVMVGTDGSDMEKGLEAAWVALTEPFISDANNGFLRDEAILSVIFVSDENDCSDQGALPADSDGLTCYDMMDRLVPIKDFVQDYRTLKDDASLVVASAIVGPDVVDGCDNTWPGTRYRAVAGAMGGIVASICEQDFSGIMSELGISAAGIRTSFGLTYPAVLESIDVWVDDTQVLNDSDNGWTYDSSTYYLTFAEAAIPPRGSVITVSYEIASGGGA